MIRRIALTAMTLLLLPGMPLVAQDTAEDEEVVSGTEAVSVEVLDDAETPDTVDRAPHPHEGFDFPSSEIESAADAGLAWLALVDAEDFAEAWATGSAVLQGSATPQHLEAVIKDGREPFRPLGARTLVGFSQLNNPPNAAPGDYVMLQYRTEASGDRTIIETVVPRQDSDAWRVAAYFIQRE